MRGYDWSLRHLIVRAFKVGGPQIKSLRRRKQGLFVQGRGGRLLVVIIVVKAYIEKHGGLERYCLQVVAKGILLDPLILLLLLLVAVDISCGNNSLA